MHKITLDQIESLAIGSTILGSGGGGDPYVDVLITQEQIAQHGPVPLVRVEQLKPYDLVVPVAFIGAPLVGSEKLPSGKEFKAIFAAIERFYGKKPTVIMPAEIGGSNAFTPLAIAGMLRLPVLDADSIGRAFPELQMSSFNVHGIPPTPAFLSDVNGNVVTIEANQARTMETIARHVTIACGSSAALAAYIMTGEQAQKAAIIGSLSKAIALGNIVKHATNPVEQLLQATQGTLLMRGVINSVEQTIDQGFLVGTATIVDDEGNKAIVRYQNENLLVTINGIPRASTPDIITILDAATGHAITSESLTYGLRVCLITFEPDPIWTTEKGLALVGPRYFGYDLDYVRASESSEPEEQS